MCLNLVKVWVFCWWFCNLFCCGNLFFVPFWLVLWDPISGFWHLDSLELNFTLVCWFLTWNSYTHYWSCDIGMMVQYCRLIMWGIFFYHPYAFHGNLQRLLSFLWDANCVEMWNYACSSWRILMGWIVFCGLGMPILLRCETLHAEVEGLWWGESCFWTWDVEIIHA